MRRIPYIYLSNNNKQVHYICPKCRHEIPRDLYKLQEWCPSCDHPINRIAKNIMKAYELLDKELFDYFIDMYRGDK